jgi:hypothetical protein
MERQNNRERNHDRDQGRGEKDLFGGGGGMGDPNLTITSSSNAASTSSTGTGPGAGMRRISLSTLPRPSSTPLIPPRPIADLESLHPSPTTTDEMLPPHSHQSSSHSSGGDGDFGVITPSEVREIEKKGKKVLFLDLRSRERWEFGRVKGEVVCVERLYGGDRYVLSLFPIPFLPSSSFAVYSLGDVPSRHDLRCHRGIRLLIGSSHVHLTH